MVKIVIFVAIVALACVNAKEATGVASLMCFASQFFPGIPTDGVFSIFKNVRRTNPAAAFVFQPNMRVISPEELFRRQTGSGRNFQAQYVSSQSSGDGKLRTSVLRNINGETTGFILTN